MAWEPKTQRMALKPIIWLNWIFGVRVFEVAGRPLYTLSIIYNIAISVLYSFGLDARSTANEERWIPYQKISYMFILWVNMIVAIFSVVLGLVNGQVCSKKIIERCAQIDDTLKLFGVKKNYKKCFRDVMCAIIIWTTLTLSLYGMDVIWLTTTFDIKYATHLSTLLHFLIAINSIGILSFCIYLRVLTAKLRKVNSVLKEIVLQEVSNGNDVNKIYSIPLRMIAKITVVMPYSRRKHFVYHFLITARYIHLEIVRISRSVNQVYRYQLLLELVVQFTLIMGTLYNLYFEVMKLNIGEIMETELSLALVCWIFVISIKIITVNNLCTCLCCEAQAVAQTLRELENCYVDDDLKNEIQQFLLQLILHPLQFSAGGFVYLNNRLTTLFFSTIATYMAILLQISSTPGAMKSLTDTTKQLI